MLTCAGCVFSHSPSAAPRCSLRRSRRPTLSPTSGGCARAQARGVKQDASTEHNQVYADSVARSCRSTNHSRSRDVWHRMQLDSPMSWPRRAAIRTPSVSNRAVLSREPRTSTPAAGSQWPQNRLPSPREAPGRAQRHVPPQVAALLASPSPLVGGESPPRSDCRGVVLPHPHRRHRRGLLPGRQGLRRGRGLERETGKAGILKSLRWSRG